jgi:Ferritin-like
LIAVTDLASASAAVAEIIEQGEGARGDWREAHYGRFLALFQEYQALRARNASFEPTRPVLAAYTRQPFDNPAPVPIIADPRTRVVAELAALAYELVLQTLTRFFTHTDETDQQLGTLIRVAVGLMAGVLRPLATELTRLPIGAPHAGCTAGFAFEMFYTLGNFVPWRESAWALLHERMSLLTDRCTTAAADPNAPEGVRQAQHRATALVALLAAHAPTALQPA